MAKPTGCLEPGELTLEVYDATVGGWTTDEDTYLHMYFIYRLPVHPPWWLDNLLDNAASVNMSYAPSGRTDIPMRVKFTHDVYHDETAGDGKLDIFGFTSVPTQTRFERSITAAIATPTWQAEDEDTD